MSPSTLHSALIITSSFVRELPYSTRMLLLLFVLDSHSWHVPSSRCASEPCHFDVAKAIGSLYHTPPKLRSSDSVQSRAVQRNLIVDFISLIRNPRDMLVLALKLLAHSFTNSIESLSAAVDGIPSFPSQLVQSRRAISQTYRLSSISFSISSSSESASN